MGKQRTGKSRQRSMARATLQVLGNEVRLPPAWEILETLRGEF